MQCPECSKINKNNNKNCEYCGAQLIKKEKMNTIKNLDAAKIIDNTPYCSLSLNNGKYEIPIIRNVSIGKASENTLTIKSKRISKKHIKITRKGDNYYLTDLNSKYGTRVNGEQIKKIELHANDIIEIGNTTIVFKNGRNNSHSKKERTLK